MCRVSVHHPAFAGTKLYCLVTEATTRPVRNLPQVSTQRRPGRESNPRLRERKTDVLPVTQVISGMIRLE